MNLDFKVERRMLTNLYSNSKGKHKEEVEERRREKKERGSQNKSLKNWAGSASQAPCGEKCS